MKLIWLIILTMLMPSIADARCYWTRTASGWYWYCEPDAPRYPPQYPPPGR